MKKKSFLIIAVLCLALLFTATVVACTGDDNTDETPGNTDVTPGGEDVTTGGDQPEEIFHTVTFDTQGGSEMPSVYIKAGTAIGAITDPLKQCQTFVGFSLNPGGGTFWNTETDPVTDNITLYAVWAAAHTWGEWQTVTAATCTDEGSQQRMCFVCGEEETQAISALGHNYAIIASDDTYHWKECCRCNSVSEKESHVYIDGLCECGEIETTTDSEFTFTELGNNQWSIAKYNGNRAYVKIPSMHNGGTVVAIGDEAFGGDTTMNLKLKSVVIPDSVTTIGDSAFYGCTALQTVEIPDSVTTIGDYAFYGCIGLTSLTIPDSVTTIGEGAFGGCIGLTSITIGEYVTAIGEYAFEVCYKLVEIYNKSNLNLTAGSDDYGCVGLYAKNIYTEENESKLSRTDDGYIFYHDGTDAYLMGYCGDERALTLPDGFTAYDGTQVNSYEIYQYAFYGCIGLTSLTIPDSVTTIGEGAFVMCIELTSVTIGDSVTTIEEYAFGYCTGLTSVTIGESVTMIGNYAFYECNKLIEVYNKSDLNIVAGSEGNGGVGDDGYIFYYDGTDGYLIGYNGDDTELTLLDSFTANDGTVINSYAINDFAFRNNNKLISVTIGDSVTAIGNSAFYGCIGLTSLTIPDSVTSIGSAAFQDCVELTSVLIPNSVTKIGMGAFSGCTQVIEIENGVSYVDKWAVDFDDSVAEVTLRNDTVGIANNTFQDSVELISVVIPDSVMTIGNNAFHGCGGLMTVTIGESVTTIGGSAFNGCAGLISVTIPDSVMTIGDSAFNGCHKLIEVYNKSKLEITAGSWDNSFVGYYAKNVYTDEGGSKLSYTDDGYIFYYDATTDIYSITTEQTDT